MTTLPVCQSARWCLASCHLPLAECGGGHFPVPPPEVEQACGSQATPKQASNAAFLLFVPPPATANGIPMHRRTQDAGRRTQAAPLGTCCHLDPCISRSLFQQYDRW